MINDLSLPTQVWQFSASSQVHLQRCIEAAKSNNNKWCQKFKTIVNNNPVLQEKEDISKIVETSVCLEIKDDPIIHEKVTITNLEHEEFCREIIDSDPIANFDYIVERCSKDSTLYHLLANTLSNTSVVKICSHIFNSKDVNNLFTEHFYRLFLPTFIKKEKSMLSLDLLVKANESNPIQFKVLLAILLSDQDIPSNILQEFVTTLNSKDKTNFILNIINLDISNEVFVNNLFTIYVAYKDCIKTEEINSSVLSKLKHVAINCLDDKIYGRFLLTYIQAQKGCYVNYLAIEKILENHRSPFKKPCINALKKE